jgi:hypothetical protein
MIGKNNYCRFARLNAMANNFPNINLRVEISNRQILNIALPIALAMLVPQINFVANTVFPEWPGAKQN